MTDPGPDWGLNARQTAFVHHLMQGMTQERAYIAAGYEAKDPRSKSSRLAANDNIRAYLHHCREQAFGTILNRLLSQGEGAVEQLAAAMVTDSPSAAKVAAAGKVLDQVLNFYSKHHLEARFARLEARIEAAEQCA